MSVVNVPANSGAQIAPGVVPGLMHIYCTGPGPATFGISIYNQPPPYTWHNPTPGNMITFQVDGFAAWIWNNGPSKIQLLYLPLEFEGSPAHQTAGVSVLEEAVV